MLHASPRIDRLLLVSGLFSEDPSDEAEEDITLSSLFPGFPPKSRAPGHNDVSLMPRLDGTSGPSAAHRGGVGIVYVGARSR